MLYKSFLEDNKFIIIFFSFFITRYLFNLILGHDHFELHNDSYWYNVQSNEILKGNFNLERLLFIPTPFFQYFQAFIKLISGGTKLIIPTLFPGVFWQTILYTLQLLISSIAGIFFYKLSFLIFKNKRISILSTFIFCFYPFTLWWTGSFAQAIWFQSFLIIFLYYFIYFLQTKKTSILIKSAIIFSFTFLTKSHILLFALFIPLIIFLYCKHDYIDKIKHIVIFTFISLLFTLPYGLYNLKVNNVYALSSAGYGGMFLLGHNDDAYLNHIKTPDPNSEEGIRLRWLKYKIYDQLEQSLKGKDFKSKQKIQFNAGLNWIKNNKEKNLELLFFNIKRFFMPGLNKSWYSFHMWITSLVITVPIYALAYSGILYNFIKKPREHSWIIFLMFSIFLFSIGFYFQGRFRTITLEPFYILYASFMLHNLIEKFLEK